MKILNIYGQYDNHTEARIVGNTEGLLALRELINDTLVTAGVGAGSASSEAGSTAKKVMDRLTDKPDESIFASDGEGYEVIIEIQNDPWIRNDKNGNLLPGTSYWWTEESHPQYLMWAQRDFLNEELAMRDFLDPELAYDWLTFKKVLATVVG